MQMKLKPGTFYMVRVTIVRQVSQAVLAESFMRKKRVNPRPDSKLFKLLVVLKGTVAPFREVLLSGFNRHAKITRIYQP
jgi:hypothetical protein